MLDLSKEIGLIQEAINTYNMKNVTDTGIEEGKNFKACVNKEAKKVRNELSDICETISMNMRNVTDTEEGKNFKNSILVAVLAARRSLYEIQKISYPE